MGQRIDVESSREEPVTGASLEDGSDPALDALGRVTAARRLIDEGELRSAERLLREAVSVEHAEVATSAAVELGRLMEQRGELEEAMAWWDLVLTHGGRVAPNASSRHFSV